MYCRELSLPKNPAHTTMRSSNVDSSLLLSLGSGQRSRLPISPIIPLPAPLANVIIIIHLHTLSQQLQSFSRLSFLENVLRNLTSSLFQNYLIRDLDRYYSNREVHETKVRLVHSTTQVHQECFTIHLSS